MDATPRRQLRCPACSWAEVCGLEGMIRWLRGAKKLRATSRVEPEIVVELLRAAAGELACPKCGHLGLTVVCADDDQVDWPGPRPCAVCGKPIAAERLAAIPGTTRCAACQRNEELGQAPSEREFCPRCGALMELRLSRGPGVARYIMTCTAQPPCRRRTS